MAVIEVAAFAVTGDEGAFLASDARMQTDFAYQQRGCFRRTTARGADGQWLVLTLYIDDEAADAASEAASRDAVAQEFWAHVVADSLRTKRYTTLE
jgi:hypothetical protein